jgi:hypothetical protein
MLTKQGICIRYLQKTIHFWLNIWVIIHQVLSVYMFTKRKNQSNITRNTMILLGFQNLKYSTILVEKENMFVVVEVLLYDAIPSNEFETFYNEANANECK